MPLATSVVFQIAGGAVLLLVTALLLSNFRDRNARAARPTRLARIESGALVVALVALGLFGLTDSDIVNAVWIVAIIVAFGMVVVRRRRGEERHPPVVVDDALRSDIADLLRDGQTIEAIKHTRKRTGGGLVAAKQAVDRVAASEGLPSKL